ncbi:hypothetical protein BSIN_3002 [Burkholderia singularis]|uniref:Uncharacterized protein n=1 Tax=Burkholderia singularis TaxID=1503053 RepID=A0A238H3V5_9BURK|nr:hypothetical protein BSIN_3002 [Burkholderia singularis]
MTTMSDPAFFGTNGTWSSVSHYGWLFCGRLEITARQNRYTSHYFETLRAQQT